MNDHERDHDLDLDLELARRSRPRRRSSSVGRRPPLQIRASNFVKKFGILTTKLGGGARIRADTSIKQPDAGTDTEHHPYRKTRSMDVLRTKPYMSSPMLAVGFQPESHQRLSADGSHESGSGSGDDTSESAHARKTSRGLNSNSVVQGLAVAALVAEASLRPPEASPNGRPRGVTIPSSVTTNHTSNQSIEARDSLVPPSSEKRSGHPRLSTLPPLNFNLKGMAADEHGSSRFSPSVIIRHPPFPILDLPALPTPVTDTSAPSGQAQSRTRRGGPRLDSMPTLPMEGADEHENDPDHENCTLDEDEEGDDEDNEDEGTGEAAGSEDEDEESGPSGRSQSSTRASSSPTSSFFARTRSFSPRLPMPSLPSPGFATLFGSVGGSSSAFTTSNERVGSAPARAEDKLPNADELATPRIGKSDDLIGNGTVHSDYFSTSNATGPGAGSAEQHPKDIDYRGESSSSRPQPPQTSSSSTTLRTPTPRDYPALHTPMISVAQPPPPWTECDSRAFVPDVRPFKDNSIAKSAGLNVPHLAAADSPKRPNIYHHASKSMIELFSTAAASSNDDVDAKFSGGIVPSAADRDAKGKGKPYTEEPSSNVQVLRTSPSKASITNYQTGSDTLHTAGTDRSGKAGLEKPLPSTPAANESAPTLRRQRSMPIFSTTGPPPPYPSFALPEQLRRFNPLPREDEGREVLPPYSNEIRLAAIMPRKMEFIAPGAPARDRKWRRVHCILEGTAFRVYDAPPRVSGVSALGGWWERKMGVGDVSAGQSVGMTTAQPGATTNIVIGRKVPKRSMKWEEELQAEEARQREEREAEDAQMSISTSTAGVNPAATPQGQKTKRHHLASSLLHPNRTRNSLANSPSSTPTTPRSSFQSSRTSAETSTPPSARASVDLSTPASSTSGASTISSTTESSTSLSGMSAGARRWGHVRSESSPSPSRSNSRTRNLDAQSRSLFLNPSSSHTNNCNGNSSSSTPPQPDERDLLRVYSLQRAESGLASDYTKRKNVVRVRMEGEQFLLQCTDVAGVVEWIEGMQAATNIALDLDERPMPKGPIFPRRRRRRRVHRTTSGTDQPSAAAETGTGERTSSSEPARS